MRHKATVAAVTMLAASLCLASCKVVPIEADRAARERLTANFDAPRYVDGIWASQAVAYWRDTERPASEIAEAAKQDLEAAGKSFGRRTGDGSPWIFAVQGEGVVSSVQTTGRAGLVEVTLPGSPSQTIVLRVGPVVSGADLRDSLPSIQFNDFNDQLAYADVGRALTARAMAQVRPTVATLKVGDQVAFGGSASVTDGSEPLVVTPYRLARTASAGGGT